MDTELSLSDVIEKIVEVIRFISNPLAGISNILDGFTDFKKSIISVLSSTLPNRLFDIFSEVKPFFTNFGMSFLNFCSVSSFGDIKTIFFMLLGVAFFALLVKVILFFF
ncbi:MAG: hypothetical protein SOY02_01330 [Candidatus Onthovivens sp.]|nr:hypothetical protein [Candidatus Onthovivens sp.]